MIVHPSSHIPPPDDILVSSPRRFSRRLVFWLSCLCVPASLAAIQALFFPRWPAASSLDSLIYTNSVSQARLKPILLSPLPPQRNAERSLSSALRWRLVDGDQLILLHAAVRQRPQFEVSFMTQGQRSISLDHRSHNPASSSSDYGLTNGRPTIQTCLVLNPPLLPIATTNSDNLAMITDQRSRRLSQFALSLLGLKLSRDYQCLLVTLSSPSARPVNIKTWKKVLERIQLAYRDSNLSSL